LLNEFTAPDIYKKFIKEEEKCAIKYAQLKEELAKAMSDYFMDFREKFSSLNDGEIKKILEAGAKKIRPNANKKISNQ